MALTRDFKEAVAARVQNDLVFAAIKCKLNVEVHPRVCDGIVLPASSQEHLQPTKSDISTVSARLTPSEINLLRQSKKSISDYVQSELPVRLKSLNLEHFLNKG